MTSPKSCFDDQARTSGTLKTGKPVPSNRDAGGSRGDQRRRSLGTCLTIPRGLGQVEGKARLADEI